MSTPQTNLRDQAARKVMTHLIPLLMVVYFTARIDKANIAMAKDSLGADIGLSAAAYGLGTGIFFISYMLPEIPSNLVLHKVGPRWWIGRISVTWGVITAAAMFVHNEWTPGSIRGSCTSAAIHLRVRSRSPSCTRSRKRSRSRRVGAPESFMCSIL
ncbi:MULTISPECIES: hypothetical protein [unclassified Streptomyces]|uniref:hypothetical protein n=1 Tax=unclassified Streptomyces TaxID=2593676 RepID=UPI002DD81B18|nr:hypothetical protein [Streptomyces sp. NBC_01445]WSE11356.1 hypothetical protein OG574_49910 [Streptomyces sp. NBC_01445]